MAKDDIPNGAIVWQDLTVKDADLVSEFYASVVGWEKEPVSMGDYNDFNMNDAEGETASGVCHAKGINADLPAQWLLYVKVDSVADSAQKCIEHGGEIVFGPGKMGENLFAVIRDPAGAVLAVME